MSLAPIFPLLSAAEIREILKATWDRDFNRALSPVLFFKETLVWGIQDEIEGVNILRTCFSYTNEKRLRGPEKIWQEKANNLKRFKNSELSAAQSLFLKYRLVMFNQGEALIYCWTQEQDPEKKEMKTKIIDRQAVASESASEPSAVMQLVPAAHWHEDSIILGNRAALEKLRAVIDATLAGHPEEEFLAHPGDGEMGVVKVRMVPETLLAERNSYEIGSPANPALNSDDYILLNNTTAATGMINGVHTRDLQLTAGEIVEWMDALHAVKVAP